MEAAEIASLRRRFLASSIDGVVMCGPIMLTLGGGTWLRLKYHRRRSGSDAMEEPGISPGEGRLAAFGRFGESRRWRLALQAASLPIEIRLRNWRSPGMRITGIRRADARSGGPVTARSVVVREAVVTAWRELIRSIQRPSDERFREHQRLMKADLEEVRRRLGSDPDARDRAVAEVSKRYRVTPWTSCGRGFLGTLPPYLPALWSERNQSLPDRLAGIIVVRD